MDDAQAFECSLWQERAPAYQGRYRPCSEEQNIAASPMTQHLWSHFDDLRGPFSEKAFRLERELTFCDLTWIRFDKLRGLPVFRAGRRQAVFKVSCQQSSNLCALVDQPTIMLRSVSHPSARTRITWGTTKRINTHISQKCQMRALS